MRVRVQSPKWGIGQLGRLGRWTGAGCRTGPFETPPALVQLASPGDALTHRTERRPSLVGLCGVQKPIGRVLPHQPGQFHASRREWLAAAVHRRIDLGHPAVGKTPGSVEVKNSSIAVGELPATHWPATWPLALSGAVAGILVAASGRRATSQFTARAENLEKASTLSH